jgi:hypothetical protein
MAQLRHWLCSEVTRLKDDRPTTIWTGKIQQIGLQTLRTENGRGGRSKRSAVSREAICSPVCLADTPALPRASGAAVSPQQPAEAADWALWPAVTAHLQAA